MQDLCKQTSMRDQRENALASQQPSKETKHSPNSFQD